MKPKFDPSQPYEAAQAQKPKFDPSQPFEEPPSGPDISKGESGLRGAAQGATLGFADEISGGVEALWEKAKGDPRAFGELYKNARDESRKNFSDANKANPKSYMAGEIGGAIGTALIPGMAAARGAKVSQVALQSAALGGMSGAGYSNAEDAGGVAKDAAIGTVMGGAIGAGAAKAGQMISRATAKAPAALAPKTPSLPVLNEKPNANQIRAAAKELGVDLTDAQLLDDGMMQKLSSLLQQSPTLVGQSRAGVVKKGIDAASRAAEESLEGASSNTVVQVGEKVKGALASKIRDEKAPISQLYERLRESTQNMELSPKSLSAISRNMLKMREANLGGLKSMVGGVADDVLKLKTVDDVKFLRTQMRGGISPTSSPAEKNAVGILDRKLKALEDATVLRTAKNFAFLTKDKVAGKEVMKLIDERRSADKAYAQFMEKLKDFSGVIKGGKVGTPESFVQKIEAMPEEELTKRLFARSNAKGLKFIKDNFPEEAGEIFGLEKTKLIQRHSKRGEKLNAQGLVNELLDDSKYGPEIRAMMFTPKQLERLKAAKTYFASLPANANPSQTAVANEILSFWGSPVKAAGMTARDLIIQGVLKSAQALDGPAVEKAMIGAAVVKEAGRKSLSTLDPAQRALRPAVVQGASSRPPLPGPQRPRVGEEDKPKDENLQKSSDSPDSVQSPKKGQDKWADDGLKKLKEHGASVDPSFLKSAKAKRLLALASDFKPGSKAMEKLADKIRGLS